MIAPNKSNVKRRVINEEQVYRMRAMATEMYQGSGVYIPTICKKMGFPTSQKWRKLVSSVIRNYTWRDPDYVPMLSRRRKRVDPLFDDCAESEHRKPAYEFEYRCYVCGMGFNTQERADKCCSRLVLVDDFDRHIIANGDIRRGAGLAAPQKSAD